jgi:hypothetical protein
MPVISLASMKSLIACFVLLLALPMAVLNPLGRSAFVGFYVGVIATWLAFLIASWGKSALQKQISN